MNNTCYVTLTSSPVGPLKIITTEMSLVAILWEHEDFSRIRLPGQLIEGESSYTSIVLAQLKEYFSGKRQEFSLSLHLEGTDFQKQVWQALLTIPYGTTVSYSIIAERIAKPRAVRAVGTAIGKNPVSIIVPCHRVIGSDGSLTGFAGGIPTKAFLLNHEKSVV